MNSPVPKYIILILLVWPICALAQHNAAHEECKAMSTRTPAKLRVLALHNAFWKDIETRRVYVIALRGGTQGVHTFAEHHAIGMRDRLAIVMAAAARHDLTLLRTYYNDTLHADAIRTLHSDPMDWTAMCNFSGGIAYLLHRGADPNGYHGNNPGPFNLGLLYDRSEVPQLLLAAGYRINANYEECISSKYIVGRNRSHVDLSIRTAVDNATCKKMRRGRNKGTKGAVAKGRSVKH